MHSPLLVTHILSLHTHTPHLHPQILSLYPSLIHFSDWYLASRSLEEERRLSLPPSYLCSLRTYEQMVQKLENKSICRSGAAYIHLVRKQSETLKAYLFATRVHTDTLEFPLFFFYSSSNMLGLLLLSIACLSFSLLLSFSTILLSHGSFSKCVPSTRRLIYGNSRFTLKKKREWLHNSALPVFPQTFTYKSN